MARAPKKKRADAPPADAPAPVMPRAGPPTNLRPGGPHADHAGKRRAAAIARALRAGDLDHDAL